MGVGSVALLHYCTCTAAIFVYLMCSFLPEDRHSKFILIRLHSDN